MSEPKITPSLETLAEALDLSEDTLQREREDNDRLRSELRAAEDELRELRAQKTHQLVRRLRVHILIHLSRLLAPAFGQTISPGWADRVREIVTKYRSKEQTDGQTNTLP
jgi:chromosome segregation ATPase